MSDIICVTNRKLCCEDFRIRIEKIAKQKPSAIILREKDLSEGEYLNLAADIMDICRSYQIPCILHTFINAAMQLHAEHLHLPLHLLQNMQKSEQRHFTALGASCHSDADARDAAACGATYLIAGHIYDTDCKKGLAGRGIPFLQSICKQTELPVYAIGGISQKNVRDVMQAGASGFCIMSQLMQCDDVESVFYGIRKELANESYGS